MWMEIPLCFRKIFSVDLVVSLSPGLCECQNCLLVKKRDRKCPQPSLPAMPLTCSENLCPMLHFWVNETACFLEELHPFKAGVCFLKHLCLKSWLNKLISLIGRHERI